MSIKDWLPPVVSKKSPKGATEICIKCRGGGIVIHREVLQLKEVCSECSGHGDILWIEKMTGRKDKKKENANALQETVMCNVRDLIREITIQYSRVGIRADIAVEYDERCSPRCSPPFDNKINVNVKLTPVEDINRHVYSQKIIQSSYGPPFIKT